MNPETQATTGHHFTRLTARTRGAIAVIRVTGPNLAAKIATVFKPVSPARFEAFEPASILYGDWKNSAGSTEDLIVCPLDHEQAEIHCHGGTAAVQAICQTLSTLGFSSMELTSTEFRDMFDVSLWQQELNIALQSCQTEKTAKLLLQQLNGATARFEEWGQLPKQQVRSAIAESLRWAEFAQHLVQPWKVVLAGKPNVGKSSLINAIAGFDRAIVHNTPGTTRDVVSQLTAIDGWPVEFFDTAGIRATTNEIESQGIAAAMKTATTCDLLLHVVDANDLHDEDLEHADWSRDPDLIVVNKTDLCTEVALNSIRGRQFLHKAVFVSAASGHGIANLTSKISNRLVPELPPSDCLLPVTESMREYCQGYAIR